MLYYSKKGELRLWRLRIWVVNGLSHLPEIRLHYSPLGESEVIRPELRQVRNTHCATNWRTKAQTYATAPSGSPETICIHNATIQWRCMPYSVILEFFHYMEFWPRHCCVTYADRSRTEFAVRPCGRRRGNLQYTRGAHRKCMVDIVHRRIDWTHSWFRGCANSFACRIFQDVPVFCRRLGVARCSVVYNLAGSIVYCTSYVILYIDTLKW